MRLYLKLTPPNTSLIPFDYQKYLVGAFHKWLGMNNIHNELSLYSISWLSGGEAGAKGLQFRDGGGWFISAHDDDLIRLAVKGITSDPDVCFGMKVKEVTIKETPEFEREHRFSLNSPVLVRKTDSDGHKHVGFEEEEADTILTGVLHNKLAKAGLSCEGASVSFDRTYQKARHKLVTYRGIGNKANLCPVIVRGTPEQVAFAWNVGVGHSTGIGFGALN